MDFEDVLKQVGDFGKFQKYLVYLFLIPITSLNIFYDYMFMMTTPDHWCNVPQLANLSPEIQKKLIRPPTIEQGLPSYDKCRMYDIDYHNITTLPFNVTYLKTKECNNGWVYDKSVFEATATTQFNLVCDNAYYVSLFMCLGPIGKLIFTPIFAIISDSIGRKKTFFFIFITLLISTISPIIIRDIISFAICRFIAGSVSASMFHIPFILSMEFVGTDYRSRTSSLAAIGYSLGCCLLPVVAYLTGHWVWLTVSQLVITIPFFILWRILPESSSWLITQKRYDEAYEVLKRVAKINGKEVPNGLRFQIQKVGAKQEELKKTQTKDSVWDLIRIPRLRKMTLILILLLMANETAYTGLSLNSLNFHGNEFLNYFLLSLTDIPAVFMAWYLIEGRLGRRWTNSMAQILCGISLCVPILLEPSQRTFITIMTLIGKAGTAASYSIVNTMEAEIFPTTLRSEGMGLCGCFGAFAQMGRYGIWIPLAIIGPWCLIAGIASSFLPETLNENLPQNSVESRNFGKNKTYFSLAAQINTRIK